MLLMCGLSFTTFLCSVSPSLYALTVFRFATGLFAAGIIAVSLGISGEHYDREILPKFVSLFLGIIFLGQGISAGIGGIIIQSLILHVPYTDTGFLLMLFGVMCFLAGYINKYLLKHFSCEHLVRAGFLSTWTALLLFLFENTPATLLAIVLLGTGYIFIQSILASTALHTGTHKGLSSGIIGIAIFGGGGLGTYVNSLILGTFHFPALILFLLALEGIIVFASFKTKPGGSEV